MLKEEFGAIPANTRVAVGQLIVVLPDQCRCLVCNVTLAHYQKQAVS